MARHQRGRLESKLVNQCRSEKKVAKEHGQMLERIVKLEKGEVPHRTAKG